jgi:NosR/NirI family transcriptional regulator, nitrous oxide reductase regulator
MTDPRTPILRNPLLVRIAVVAAMVAVVVVCAGVLQASEPKFALPEFKGGYQRPPTSAPPPNTSTNELLNLVAILVTSGIVLLSIGLAISRQILRRQSGTLRQQSWLFLILLVLFNLTLLFGGLWVTFKISARNYSLIASIPVLQVMDIVVLTLALVAAGWLVLFFRSRRALWVLSIVSLLYFGFWRAGCICTVGSIQNVALVLSESNDWRLFLLHTPYLGWIYEQFCISFGLSPLTGGGTYVIPLTAVAFFSVPLIATLLTGRTFCSSVCPLGAIQDLVAVRPVQVPKAIDQGLGLLPYVYLGAGVLFAATGSAFIICEYDPFVSFFRLLPLQHTSESMYASAGSAGMLVVGGIFLVIGIFIGRPYCRWLCPYGAILRLIAPLAILKTQITPDKCVSCRLCEHACPYNAIETPAPAARPNVGMLIGSALLTIILIFGLGFAGNQLAGPFSRLNYTVQQAEQVRTEEMLREKSEDVTAADISTAFANTGRTTDELYKDAATIRNRFAFGGMLFGGFVGLVFGLKLNSLAVGRRERKEFQIDHAKCVSCGRCFESCPRNRLKTAPSAAPGSQAS